MAQEVTVFSSNNGDGSASICFTLEKNLVDRLERHDPEGYGHNEGGSKLYFPHTLNLVDCGFTFVDSNDFNFSDDEE